MFTEQRYLLGGLCFQSVETIFDAADIRSDDFDIPSLAGGDSKKNGEIFVDLSHMARLCRRESPFCLSFILRAQQLEHRYFPLERSYAVFLSWHGALSFPA